MGAIVDPLVDEPPAMPTNPERGPAEGAAGTGALAGSAAEADEHLGTPPPPATAIVSPKETAASAETPPSSSSHPVRDKLLARARQAAAKPTTPPPPTTENATPLRVPSAAAARNVGESDSPRPSAGGARSNLDAELDEIVGKTSHLRLPGVGRGTGSLPPNGTLLLAGLLGATALASLFALLMQFAPNGGEKETAPPPTAPTTSAAASSELAPPPAPPPREKQPGPWRIGSSGGNDKVIRGRIGQEPFLKAIQSAGLSKDQAYRVYGSLKETKNLDRCRPRDEFVALLEKGTGRVLAFEYIVSPAEIYQTRETDGKLESKALDLHVKRGRVQGAIVMTSSSFADAARAASFDPGLGRVVNQALDGHSAVEEFNLGDRLRVVAQEVTILGEFYRYSGIEALEYVPKGGDPIRIYYNAERKRYYDAKGRSPGEGGFRKPCKGAPITSRFNPKRLHPILKKRMPHNGTDFGAPTGTPIGASAPGEIVKRGNYGPNGNFIAIKHRGGYETGYSHLSRFEPGLEVGSKVGRMQIIGYVGSTGRSTGPHLHFSAKKDGKFIDPESLQLDALTVLAKAERAKFEPIRQKYDKLLDAVALPPLPAEMLAAPAVAAATPEGSSSPAGLSPADIARLATEPAAPAPAPIGQRSAEPAAQAAPAQPANVPPPAQRPTGSALYLDDEELIQSQSAVDDGEVAE